jgi:hypothetical protein
VEEGGNASRLTERERDRESLLRTIPQYRCNGWLP